MNCGECPIIRVCCIAGTTYLKSRCKNTWKRIRQYLKKKERAVLLLTTIGNPATPASAGSDPKPDGLRVA